MVALECHLILEAGCRRVVGDMVAAGRFELPTSGL